MLARNERSFLPLDRAALGRVAVIGPNAEVARTLGGGSATVFPPYTISPLDGLRAAGLDVAFAPGAVGHLRAPAARAPWLLRPDRSGPGTGSASSPRPASWPLPRAGRRLVHLDERVRSGGPGRRVARLEISCVIQATGAGPYQLGVSGLGRFRLLADGAELFDVELTLPEGADIVEALMAPPQRLVPLDLAAGQPVAVRLEHDVQSSRGGLRDVRAAQPGGAARYRRRGDRGGRDPGGLSDVAVIVAGTTAEVESEGFDRPSLALPDARTNWSAGSRRPTRGPWSW